MEDPYCQIKIITKINWYKNLFESKIDASHRGILRLFPW
jgi:hypothetical protein